MDNFVVGNPLTLNCGFFATQTYLPLIMLLSTEWFKLSLIFLSLLGDPLAFPLPPLPNSSRIFLRLRFLSRMSSIQKLFNSPFPLAFNFKFRSLYWLRVIYGKSWDFLFLFLFDFILFITYIEPVNFPSGFYFYSEFNFYQIVQYFFRLSEGDTCRVWSALCTRWERDFSFFQMYFRDEFREISQPLRVVGSLFFIYGLFLLKSSSTLPRFGIKFHGHISSTGFFYPIYSRGKNVLSKNLLEVIIYKNIHSRSNNINSLQQIKQQIQKIQQFTSNKSQKMKGLIIGLCGLVLQGYAQFNFQVNQGGLRFGILGTEVVNLGGQNKDKAFTNSFPNDVKIDLPTIPSIPIPSIQLPNIQIPSIQGQPIPPHQSVNPSSSSMGMGGNQNSQKKLVKVTDLRGMGGQAISKPDETQKIEVQTLQTEANLEQKTAQKQSKQPIKQIQIGVPTPTAIKTPSKPASSPVVPSMKKSPQLQVSILNVQAQPQTEEEITERNNKEYEQIKKKQQQKLLKFVHLMPQSQKQHLRAIATDRISG